VLLKASVVVKNLCLLIHSPAVTLGALRFSPDDRACPQVSCEGVTQGSALMLVALRGDRVLAFAPLSPPATFTRRACRLSLPPQRAAPGRPAVQLLLLSQGGAEGGGGAQRHAVVASAWLPLVSEAVAGEVNVLARQVRSYFRGQGLLTLACPSGL
jgi:hypothetical protein